MESSTYCKHMHTIERECIHAQLTHPTHTPTHAHTYLSNSLCVHAASVTAEVQLYVGTNTHIVVQQSPPSLRLKAGNDSVPLCFLCDVCVSVYICCICVHSCHFVNVLRVCEWMWMWSGPVIFQAAQRKPTSTAIHHTLGIDLPSEGRNGMARLASPLLRPPSARPLSPPSPPSQWNLHSCFSVSLLSFCLSVAELQTHDCFVSHVD